MAKSDVARLPDGIPTRRAIADVIAGDDAPGPLASGGRDSDRLVGTLVHRLLQRLGFGGDANTARAAVAQWIRAEELDEATLDAAVAAYDVLSRREDVGLLYSSGDALHEVPFTMRADGTWLRGTIDCVVRDRSGLLTVLEFKTGRPRPEHRTQVELYRRAAEQMFPGHRVEARLVYADDISPLTNPTDVEADLQVRLPHADLYSVAVGRGDHVPHRGPCA